MRKWSLKTRFLVFILLLVAAGLFASSFATYRETTKSLKRSIVRQVAQTADAVSEMIDLWLKDRVLDVTGWSEDRMFLATLKSAYIARSARKAANDRFARLKARLPFYEHIGIADPDGTLVAADTEDILDEIRIHDRKYFQESLQGRVYLSDVVASRATGNPVFVVSAPLKEGETVVGVIFGVLDLSFIQKKFVDNAKVGENGYAFIVDRDGRFILHPKAAVRMKQKIQDRPRLFEHMKTTTGHVEYEAEGGLKISAFRSIEQPGWTLGVTALGEEILVPIQRLKVLNGIVGLVILAFLSGLILAIVHSIVDPIDRVIRGLSNSAGLVDDESRKLLDIGRSLTAGSAEQSGAVEETSSTLEEISSMTRQNAENTAEADRLMKEALSLVQSVGDMLNEQNQAMNRAIHTSEEMHKIIKSIDEIAFQTNLLALNAAVEAARAGDSGAGFAVVAEEVRNLAKRAADAVQNTSTLIDGSVDQIRESGDLTRKINEGYTNVAVGVSRIGEILSDIAAASDEQARGIDQVNIAVGEMQRIIQQNVEHADNSSASSAYLNEEAGRLKGFVGELRRIVSGNRKSTKETPKDAGKPPSEAKKIPGGRSKPSPPALPNRGPV
jgi:methyl-accepting chemotaxis protein